MAHVGKIGDKITAEVTLVGIYKYTDYAFSFYGTDHYIYTMKDAESNVYVWKTTSFMSVETDEDCWYPIKKNDKIQITGTIKDHSEYKDEPQTVLQRVKVKLIERALTYEEIKAMKQQEQLATLQEGDFVWTMPYKQYKEHYADCETIYGSFNDHEEENSRRRRNFIPKTIDVIIRSGRLKNSGTRGEHYSGYEMTNELGQKITYRAVKEENALQRVKKDFPEHTWECTKIYDYGREW